MSIELKLELLTKESFDPYGEVISTENSASKIINNISMKLKKESSLYK